MPETKEKKFRKERIETYNKMVDILNLNTNKNTFVLYHLDKNEKVQNEINSLKQNISLYYSGSSCRGLNKKGSKRPYMSIIRFLLKEHGFKLVSYDFSVKAEEEDYPPIRTKRYQILSNSNV